MSIRIKVDIKTKWNKILMDEIEKKIQLRKEFKTRLIAIQRIWTKSNRWKKLKDDEIKKKSIL
jgi:hypothetical protein